MEEASLRWGRQYITCNRTSKSLAPGEAHCLGNVICPGTQAGAAHLPMRNHASWGTTGGLLQPLPVRLQGFNREAGAACPDQSVCSFCSKEYILLFKSQSLTTPCKNPAPRRLWSQDSHLLAGPGAMRMHMPCKHFPEALVENIILSWRF